MPKGLQVLSGFVTAPGATLTPWTMAAGDSLAVRNTPEGAEIRLLNLWADNQTAGNLRVRSALLHDNVQGINYGVAASEVYPLMPYGRGQMLKPQDLLIVEQSGSATAGDIEAGALLLYYADLPGADARLATWAQIEGRIESYMVVFNTLATGTAGGYSGEEAINAEVDQFKANRDYALLGYLCSAECTTIGWRGPDTSNLRVGGPGNESNRMLTHEWFKHMSLMTGLPTIPIINAANKAATLIDAVQDENGVDVTVSTTFALLR